MAKGYLIDSNVIIGYLDNKLPNYGMKLMHSIVDKIPNISVISKIEVLRHNPSEPVSQILQAFIDECNIFDLTEPVVDNTIELCKSRRIKLPDAIIAATARVHNFSLVTRNVSDFVNIKSLPLINPWEPK